jgi:hypothetical protein
LKTKLCVLGLYSLVAATVAGCSAMPQAPTAPSATSGGSLNAASDGSTLKASPPAVVSPIDGVDADSRTPTLVWANSNGNFAAVGMAYEIEIQAADGSTVYSMIVGETPNTGSHKVGKDLAQNVVHSWRIRAALGETRGPWSIWAEFKVPAPVVVVPKGGGVGLDGFRTPDPPAGQRLPLINRQGVIQEVANANPGALRNSCQHEGGSWLFVDLAVDALQAIDLRWGYNAKRGNMNDPSVDVASYHWGAGPSEGSSNVYIIDFIGGHCGSNPTIIWNDVTQVTLDSNNVGRYMYRRPGRAPG